MFRWIAIIAAAALAIGAAYAQSSSPSQMQPTLPLGQSQAMGQMMGSPMMNSGMMGSSMMDPGMMSMMQMMGSGMMGQDMAGPMMCRAQMGMVGTAGTAASYLEARLAFAKSELAIDPAQEADWQRFAAALRGQAQPMSARMSEMQHAMATDSDLSTKFDARMAVLEGQVSSLKAIRDAAVGLYGRLSAAQKHGADTLLPMSLCL